MDLKEKILKLKKERNAVILAHYYQSSEVQDIADYVGDSYYLSKIGVESEAEIIVFCGVKFMAESAKILSPNKRVFLPNKFALCGMARMAEPEKIEELKKEHADAKVVCYVNSTTEVKAVSDVCCTSSSAEKIVNNLECEEIIFVPDKNLGSYIQEQVSDKEVILWDGHCCIHNDLKIDEVIKAKEKYGQDVEVLIHPECTKEVRALGDFIGSTGQIIEHATESTKKEFIIVTDVGILHELKKRNPEKKFHSLDMVCDNMKITTLEDIYECLKDYNNEIFVDENLRAKAQKSLREMHRLSK